jgi:hypothetical protein
VRAQAAGAVREDVSAAEVLALIAAFTRRRPGELIAAACSR